MGRKAEAGPKEIPEAFLEKTRKEKAGGVALTLTDPGEDSRNREPRESSGNDSQLCLALLRKTSSTRSYQLGDKGSPWAGQLEGGLADLAPC